MEIKDLKRMIYRLFPELTADAHLPRWGRVEALPELPEEGDMSDRFYPHYAADVQLLDEQGKPLADRPVMQAVPLPIPGNGDHAGLLIPPAVGSIVELGWIFGQADKPFIRTVIPYGWKLPAIKEGEYRYQQRKGVYKLVDQEGNFRNITDKLAELKCQLREVTATDVQDYRAPISWFGSEKENVLRLLSELMQVVTDLSDTCAAHKHTSPETGAPTSTPDKADNMTGHGEASTALKGRLDPITK
ncbi:hypothetical protein NF212_16250 [Parasalinivibrio latis]|uniref:hypothetical protein n=1 Tax=Parasalinivibrio latis TaxID=2952610 RepID=UPI0030DEF8E7